MTHISLSFSPPMALAILEGRKVCTTRLAPKGEPGDTFTVAGFTYRLICIDDPMDFNWLADYYQLEGFDTPEQMLSTLYSIYPGSNGDTQGCLHWFAWVMV